jgi:hypothetical protein
MNRLADIEVTIDCELGRCGAFDVASRADDFYAPGDRGIALLFLTCAGRKLAIKNALVWNSSEQLYRDSIHTC